jgi:hypothetical protein
MVYSGQLDVVNKIKNEREELLKLKTLKQRAGTLSQERDILLQMIRKEEYIRGLNDALGLIQKDYK